MRRRKFVFFYILMLTDFSWNSGVKGLTAAVEEAILGP
jgi:hypothetical protein